MVTEINLIPPCNALRRVISKGSNWIKVSSHYLGVPETASLKCSKTHHLPGESTTGVTEDSSSKSKNLWRLIFQVSQILQNTKFGHVHFSFTQQRESMVPAHNSVIHLDKKEFAFSETSLPTTTQGWSLSSSPTHSLWSCGHKCQERCNKIIVSKRMHLTLTSDKLTVRSLRCSEVTLSYKYQLFGEDNSQLANDCNELLTYINLNY